MSEKVIYKKSMRPWLILIFCCLMQAFGFYTSSMMVSIFVTPLMTEFDCGLTPLQSYFTVQLLLSIPVLLLSGTVLKKIGAPVMVTLGAVCVGGSWMLLSFMPSLPMYYVVAALNAVYPWTCLYIIPVLINNWFYKNRALWISVAMAFSGVGSFFLSPFITGIVTSSGWNSAALLIGAVTLIVIGVAGIFVVRNSPIPMGLLPQGATQEDVEAMLAEEASKADEDLDLPGIEWKAAIKTPAFAMVFFAMLLIGVLSAFNTNVNPLVQNAGYGAAVAGFTMSAAAVGQIIGKPVAGFITDKWGAGWGNAFGFGLFAVGACLYLAALHITSVPLIYAAGFIAGCGVTVTLNMPALVTTDAFGLKDYAILYSIMASTRALGLALTNPVVASVVDGTGSYDGGLVIWIVAAILIIPVTFKGISMGKKLWNK